jgi:hypothetical protein
VETGTEAAQFSEKEHINGIFVAVWALREKYIRIIPQISGKVGNAHHYRSHWLLYRRCRHSLGSSRGGAGTHLVLAQESETLSILNGSFREGAGTHLVLVHVEEMQTLSVLFSLPLVEEV